MMLNTREWKPFKVGELFTIEKCKCNNVSKLKKGNTPYVGATNKNNGTMSFIDNYSNLITKGNCIVFICDGQGSVGYSIYKKEDFIGSTTLKVGRYENINKYNALFITSALDKNKSIYDYGYKRNEIRLKNEHIYLPSINNAPDWEFMENYVKELEIEKSNKYEIFLKTVLKDIKIKEIVDLNSKKWKTFFLTDIFTQIQRGKRLTKAKQIDGTIPYVSSTSFNNGVDNFISNKKNVRRFSDCISIANSGSVGSSFYQPYEFVASDHITHLKNDKMNKYIYLFIATMTNRFSEKYNFNREINDNRISRETILLPINDKEEPDYEYMEQYIKNLMYKKYNQYKDFIAKKAP